MGVWKRGLSPVIASVLMILLVLVLSSVVFAWARGLVNDKGEEIRSSVSADALCRAVDFDVVVVDKVGDDYEFEAVNRGNVNISSLRFRIFPGGDSNVVNSAVGLWAGSSVAGHVVLTGVIERVEALGVLDGELVGSSSDVVCAKNPVKVKGA